MERKLEAQQTPTTIRTQPAQPKLTTGKYHRIDQPTDVIDVPGALLRLDTLAKLAGVGISTLYRDARDGELILSKRGTRCTRVTSENARAYLARMSGAGS